MKVTIMITTYNCESYVDSAIESVIKQEMLFEWELLIGDDGSSDNTIEHIKTWIDRHPRNIHLFIMDRSKNDEKNGTRAARNRANLLEHATGEYLIFLDGDDQFLGTEKLKKQVEILDSPLFQNCSCVAHNILANDILNKKKYLLTSESVKDGIVDSKYYWENLYFHTNTLLFRKRCVLTMLNPQYRDFLNDNFITYVIMQYGSIYYLHEVWGQYNLTGNGLWTGKKRTYGCFRNLILFDLEKDINPDFVKASFIRHLYDFRYIFKYYDLNDRAKVQPLVSDLDEQLFRYTLLLYRTKDELTEKERLERTKLKVQVEATHFLRYFVRIKIYIRRLFNK